MSDHEEVFFWEHPEAREKLLALRTATLSEEVSEDEVIPGEVSVQRLDKVPFQSAKSQFAQEELYSRRLRVRDWRQKFDRVDHTGAGDHRC